MNEIMKQDKDRQLAILKKVEAEAERFFSQRQTGKALPIYHKQKACETAGFQKTVKRSRSICFHV